MTPRGGWIAGAVVLLAAACRPPSVPSVTAAPVLVPGPIERGAVTYAAYCAGCHGPRGTGDGSFARTLGLPAANLRAAKVRSASDAALIARLMRGTPIVVPSERAELAETRDVDALVEYLPRLAATDWDVLRAGRLVYEGACAPCHGAYGRAEDAVAYWLGVPDLVTVRDRLSDAALARISESGTGLMPPLYNAFDRGELRALIAYIRHLSDGFQVYDTHCAACHGDDGQGQYSEDAIPPATAAPPLRGPYPRAALVHMLRRERGVMPHFRELDERRIRDVVAYLRAAVFQKGEPGGGDSRGR
jgi:mono/diheme cytochrome c family protein